MPRCFAKPQSAEYNTGLNRPPVGAGKQFRFRFIERNALTVIQTARASSSLICLLIASMPDDRPVRPPTPTADHARAPSALAKGRSDESPAFVASMRGCSCGSNSEDSVKVQICSSVQLDKAYVPPPCHRKNSSFFIQDKHRVSPLLPRKAVGLSEKKFFNRARSSRLSAPSCKMPALAAPPRHRKMRRRDIKSREANRPGYRCSVGADQYMPPMPPALAAAAAAASAAGSGLSATMDSVVRTQAPMDAAFSSAVRVTFVGSTIPAGIMSQ